MTISRNWATPLTIGSFLLMAVTGILMFFHLDTGLNKAAHEWLGWAMVAGVVAHGVANGPAFVRHLKQPVGRVLIGVFAVLLIGSFLVPQQGGGSPAGLAINTLTHAPLSRVAALRGEPVEALVGRLEQAGFTVQGPDQNLASVAGDREQVGKALRAALPTP